MNRKREKVKLQKIINQMKNQQQNLQKTQIQGRIIQMEIILRDQIQIKIKIRIRTKIKTKIRIQVQIIIIQIKV